MAYSKIGFRRNDEDKPDTSPALQAIEYFITEHYPPATTVIDADLLMTLAEIYMRVSQAFPGACKPDDIAGIMKNNNYILHTFGDMRSAYLLKKL